MSMAGLMLKVFLLPSLLLGAGESHPLGHGAGCYASTDPHIEAWKLDPSMSGEAHSTQKDEESEAEAADASRTRHRT